MNERIEELAEQANYLATEKEFPYDVDWFYLYNKRFAELIVEECSKINNQFIGHRIGEIDLNIVYKQHFGIKE